MSGRGGRGTAGVVPRWIRLALDVQGGRVELDELQVGQDRPGPQGGGDAVAGGQGRVGGVGEQLAGAAAGQHDRARPDQAGAAVDPEQGPGDPPVGGQEVDQEGVLDAVDGRGGPDRLGQGPLQLGPGGVAAGVDDPRARVPALPGLGQLPGARGVGVEADPELAQVGDGLAALLDQQLDRHRVAQAGPGGQGVGHVLGHRVADQVEHGRDPALGVAGGRVAEAVLGGQAHRPAGRHGQGGRQPGHPGADHQDVDLLRLRLRGIGGQQAARDQHVVPRCSVQARLGSRLNRHSWLQRMTLSIRRVRPTRAAVARTWPASACLAGSKVASSTRAT